MITCCLSLLLTGISVPGLHDRQGASTPIEARTDSVKIDHEGEWVACHSDRLKMRVRMELPAFPNEAPIVLVAEVVNESEYACPMIKPFGDEYVVKAARINITGPDGPIVYTGDIEDYELGAGSFLILGPGETFIDRLTLAQHDFEGIQQSGEYQLEFTFSYEGEWDYIEGSYGAWQGEVQFERLKFEREN